MGLLTKGSPLSWKDTEPVVDYVKKHGIIQFIKLYHRLKSRQGDQLRWGDEVEYMIVTLDHKNKKVIITQYNFKQLCWRSTSKRIFHPCVVDLVRMQFRSSAKRSYFYAYLSQ